MKDGRRPISAFPDRLIERFQHNNIVSEIISLSPSDESIENFDFEISQLITEYGHLQER